MRNLKERSPPPKVIIATQNKNKRKNKMKRLVMIATVVCLALIAVTAVPSMAASPSTVTLSWVEDGARYYPDGTLNYDWTAEPMEVDFLNTGNAYHIVNINDFYYYVLPDIAGDLVISGAGNLSGHATYTSLASGLPIKEQFKGQVAVDQANGTLEGTFTQYSYAFGPKEEIDAHYPGAVPEKSEKAQGWWFIGYTVYNAY